MNYAFWLIDNQIVWIFYIFLDFMGRCSILLLLKLVVVMHKGVTDEGYQLENHCYKKHTRK